MKKMLMLAFLVMSSSAFADQCSALSAHEADRASLMIQIGSEIATVCVPCGEKVSDARFTTVTSIDVNANMSFEKLTINGKGVDLAYTYLKVAPNKYINVARSVGCVHEGSPSVLSK